MEIRKTRISLQEVARQAGVSAATVSRVLNNSAAIRARVMDAAARLGCDLALGAHLLSVPSEISVMGFDDNAPAAHSNLESRLIVRDSTGPVRVP